MTNEFEMRDIFNELNSQNQMKLVICAKQFHIIQKEKRNEKTINDGNVGLYAGIRDKGGICSNGKS